MDIPVAEITEVAEVEVASELVAPMTDRAIAPTAPKPKKAGMIGNIGQGLAYVGILAITAGFSLVIMSSFGGPARGAPTGWLIATIGQMMLFLGIVTLVSAGMEQSSAEVRSLLDERLRSMTERLEFLSQKIIRIEQGKPYAGPKPPHFLTKSDQRDSSQAAGNTRDA